MFLKIFRSFQRGTVGLCRSKRCKITSCQSWRSQERSASRPRPQSASLPGFEPRSRSNHSQSLMAGNFAALWPTDPKFLALKDLNPFKIVSKVQKTSSILRVGFALSKWPHLHRAYVVGGCLFNFGTVFKQVHYFQFPSTCAYYSRAQSVQGGILFKEIQYLPYRLEYNPSLE